ncbi:MAG: hypothetical protein QW228_05710 [Candidatus Aenigmatarchaeota archaeon]
MKGQIIKIKEDNFKDGKGYWVFFKMEDGGSGLTYLLETFGNFNNWKPYLRVGQTLDGLRWKNKKKRIIDADSMISPTIDLEKMARLRIFE